MVDHRLRDWPVVLPRWGEMGAERTSASRQATCSAIHTWHPMELANRGDRAVDRSSRCGTGQGHLGAEGGQNCGDSHTCPHNTNADTHADRYPHRHANQHTNADQHINGHPYAHADTDGLSQPNGDTYADTDSLSQPNGDTYADTDSLSQPNGDTYADSYINAHSHANLNADSNAYTDTNTHAHPDTDANSNTIYPPSSTDPERASIRGMSGQ